MTTEVNPQVNLVNNSSFEQGEPVGAFATIKAGDGLLPGWQVARGSIDMLGSYWPASHGGQCLDLHGASGIGAIRQTLTTEPGQSYEVRFDMAGDPECGATLRKIRVTAAGQSSDFSFDPKNNTRQHWVGSPTNGASGPAAQYGAGIQQPVHGQQLVRSPVG